VLFKHIARVGRDGTRLPTYYANESAGIAAGFFIAAIHNLGLVTLTHTPSPMGFLSEILERPNTEKPYLLMPVGYPAESATIPDISRKPLVDVLCWR
jgi:nitroreductase